MSTETDRILIQQIRGGDESAWDKIIERYEGRLQAFVERRIHDRAATEDVVQDTFIGFLTSLPNFDEKRGLQTYLFSIASYKLTDYLRKLGRHPLQHISNAPGDPLYQELDTRSRASSLFRSQERRELESEALVRCLRQLINEWRTRGDFLRIKVLELLFVKGMANKDVAAFLEIDDQKVANYRFDAVKRIKDYIRNAGLSPDVFPGLQPDEPNTTVTEK
ncbi:MAG: RNA polymerase sigma factor [Gemmataceae bacterium]